MLLIQIQLLCLIINLGKYANMLTNYGTAYNLILLKMQKSAFLNQYLGKVVGRVCTMQTRQIKLHREVGGAVAQW